MVIRKYIAMTEEEATNLAKEDLGESAIIMSVKAITPRGLARFFKKASVEITAAVDEVESDVGNGQADSGFEQDLPDFSKLQEAIQETNAVLAAEEAKKEAGQGNDGGSFFERTNREKRDVSFQKDFLPETEEKNDIEERLSNLQDLLEKQLQADRVAEEEKEEKENTNQAYYDLIRKKLLDNEVEETYVNQILDDITETLGKNANLDSILAGVYQKIVLKIGQPHLIDIRSKKVKYIFFVGPTGVGKTTTIAKIASTLKLTKKTKVALVTSDTYRIAAVEQLKTYANILGIPLKVVYSTGDMGQVVEDLRNYELVLVDTAGRSHSSKEQREDVQKLIESVNEENREVFLVLSATTKYKDLAKIATIYAEMTKYTLVFTKLDETDTVGNIFNIHMLTGAPLSYTTWGQNVPDDIGKINAQNMAKQLLGGNS